MKHLRSAVLAAAAATTVALTGAAKAVDFEVGGTKLSIYGQAHISVDSVNNGDTSTLKIASNSSRLGFKASKEIADGITAVAQYEVGVDLTGIGGDDGNGGDFGKYDTVKILDNNGNDTGNKLDNATKKTAGLFTSARDSYLGIAGSFGTIVAGNLPAINQYLYDYNLFADQVGDLGNIWGAGSAIQVDRASDTIAYFIPNVVPGLSGDVAYVSDLLLDGNVDSNHDTAYLVKLNYEIAGLKLGVCYVQVNTTNKNPKDIAITASYKYENLSVGGGYLQADPDTGNKKTSFTVGASFTVSGATLKAQYTSLSDDADKSNASQIAVGVDYGLGDNLTVYAAYAATNNDANVSYSANDWGHGKSAFGDPAAGKDPNAISVGVVYKF